MVLVEFEALELVVGGVVVGELFPVALGSSLSKLVTEGNVQPKRVFSVG